MHPNFFIAFFLFVDIWDLEVRIFRSIVAFIYSLIFIKILYCQSLDLWLVWWFAFCFYFGNIKIVRFFTSEIIDCLMYGITYFQAPSMEKSFCWFFHNVIQLASSYEYNDIQAHIFSFVVELLFFPALAIMLVLIA